MTVKVPTYTDDNKVEFIEKWHTRECTKAEVLEVVAEIEELYLMPAFELLMNKKLRVVENGKEVGREICPIAFIDNEILKIIALESLCDKYHCLPTYPPTLDAQDPFLISCFMIISATKNRYELHRLERERQRLKAKK